MTSDELRHRAPQPQPSAFLPREAIDLVRAPGSAADRDELEPALQEGRGACTRHRLVRPGGPQELIEERPLRALRIRVDVETARRAGNENLSHVYADLDPGQPALVPVGAPGGLVNDDRGVCSAPRRILDRIDPERGHDPGRGQLLRRGRRTSAACRSRPRAPGSCASRVAPVRLPEGGAEERDPPAFPLNCVPGAPGPWRTRAERGGGDDRDGHARRTSRGARRACCARYPAGPRRARCSPHSAPAHPRDTGASPLRA